MGEQHAGVPAFEYALQLGEVRGSKVRAAFPMGLAGGSDVENGNMLEAALILCFAVGGIAHVVAGRKSDIMKLTRPLH
ncbi:hypothetical protein SDC9_52653 [bioreactor metagenome]|uniref:Uncharacterized protein n=1 Tax=bioreactor metagenome TaxID=1076179 RepID=A0A644WWD9_9ZZZZ